LKVGNVIEFTTELRVAEIVEEGAVATGEAGLFSDIVILALSSWRHGLRLSLHGKSFASKMFRGLLERGAGQWPRHPTGLATGAVRRPRDRYCLGPARQGTPGDLDRGMDLTLRDPVAAHDEFGDRIRQQFGKLRLRSRSTERFFDDALPWSVSRTFSCTRRVAGRHSAWA
jgi:hypothetical protein